MAKISNTVVTCMESSIFKSGYSYATYVPTDDEYNDELDKIASAISMYQKNIETAKSNFKDGDSVLTDAISAAVTQLKKENSHVRRAIVLANAKQAGEDQFLSGIHVDFDLTVSLAVWKQVQRYIFVPFTSSYSTMHRLAKMDVRSMCNEYVSEEAMLNLEKKIQDYKDAVVNGDTEEIRKKEIIALNNIPTGFELTAGLH